MRDVSNPAHVTLQPPTTLDALMQRAAVAAEPAERRAALEELGRVTPPDARIDAFLRERAAGDVDLKTALAALAALAMHDRDNPDTLLALRAFATAASERALRIAGTATEAEWAEFRAALLLLIMERYRYEGAAMGFLAERAAEEADLAVRQPLIARLAAEAPDSRTLLNFLYDRGAYDDDPRCRAHIYTCLALHAGKKIGIRDFLRRRVEAETDIAALMIAADQLIACAGNEAETWRAVRRVVGQGRSMGARMALLERLARHTAATPETHDLIYSLAWHDGDPALRAAAVALLAAHYRRDPRVRILLEGLAEHERHDSIKSAAKSALLRVVR